MKSETIKKRDVQLHIKKDGFFSFHIEGSEASQLLITVDKHISASLYITYHGIDIACNCHVVIESGSSCKILFWNEVSSSMRFQQTAEVGRDASLTIGYGDLSEAEVVSDVQAALLEEGAQVQLLTACISGQKKHYALHCLHEAAHTSSQMENYCVVKKHGDYIMKANGQIKKGAYQSTSVQKSRVLTMSEQQRSEVIPLLLIDENDVKAGHATTVGQPDERQLYYMQTRGLTREQAISLLVIGYMMPIAEIIDHEELRDQSRTDIEKKVGYHA